MEQSAAKRLLEVNEVNGKAGPLQSRVAASKTNNLSPPRNSRASGSGAMASKKSSAHAASKHNREYATLDEDEDRNDDGVLENSFSLDLLKPPPFNCSVSLGGLNESQMPAYPPSFDDSLSAPEFEPPRTVESLMANLPSDFEDAEELDADHTMNRQVPTQSVLHRGPGWQDSIPYTQDPAEAALDRDAARADTRRHSGDGGYPSPLMWPTPGAEPPVYRNQNDCPAVPDQPSESMQVDSIGVHDRFDADIAEDYHSSGRVSDRVNRTAQSQDSTKTRLLYGEQPSSHSKDAPSIMEGHVADATPRSQNNENGTRHVYKQSTATHLKAFEDIENIVNGKCAGQGSCIFSRIGTTDQLATHMFCPLTWSADEVAAFKQSETLPVKPGDERTPDHMKGLVCKVVPCAKRESILSCILKDISVLASDLGASEQTPVIFIFDVFGKDLYPGQRSYLVIPVEWLNLRLITKGSVGSSNSHHGVVGTSGGWIDLQSLVMDSILHFSCQGRNLRDLLFKIHQELPAYTGFRGRLRWKIGEITCTRNYIATISAGRVLASTARPVTPPSEWRNQASTHGRLDNNASDPMELDLPSIKNQTTEPREDQNSGSEAPSPLAADAENESMSTSSSDYGTDQKASGTAHRRRRSNVAIANVSKGRARGALGAETTGRHDVISSSTAPTRRSSRTLTMNQPNYYKRDRKKYRRIDEMSSQRE